MTPLRVAVIGAGWAGCAAAVEATRLGHHVTVFEAARTPGGRARALPVSQPDGPDMVLDNGQHILIGAYSSCLGLMRELGVNPDAAFLRLPLRLQTPDGQGLALPASVLARQLPGALQAAWGILTAHGWSWRDKLTLMRQAARWQAAGFDCAPGLSVADLCESLSPTLMQGLVEPLCVSALNTPAERSSAQVFLRVLKDALFSQAGGADLLLPRQDLGALLPDAALAWLARHSAEIKLGARVAGIEAEAQADGLMRWRLHGLPNDAGAADSLFEAVVLACPAPEAARLLAKLAPAWATAASDLKHEAIATVYAWAPPGTRLAQPMLALRSQPQAPAQFVFDRGQLGGPAGLLAFVVSASQGDRDTLTQQVLAQGEHQLGFVLEALQTVVEKRATFACTPGLLRPAAQVLPQAQAKARLLACGDYVAGPYPATLEGAVRSGLAAAQMLGRGGRT